MSESQQFIRTLHACKRKHRAAYTQLSARVQGAVDMHASCNCRYSGSTFYPNELPGASCFFIYIKSLYIDVCMPMHVVTGHI
jgi:hypothetical protein